MNPCSRFLKTKVALTVLFFVLPLGAQTLKTPAEESGWNRYTQYEDVRRFLEVLDRTSKELSVQVAGRTLETKDFGSADIYLCVINEEGAATPQALNRDKPTILIVASQHGNEQSAKEAALQVVRDLAAGELKPLLKQLNLLVIPQANPYGNFVDRRQNEQNLDLNRDHVKLESPETQAIHKVFRAWMPEVTLDLHEKGDDYYRVSTGCVSNINIHPDLEKYSRERVFPALEKLVAADGFTWHEYLVSEAMGSTQAAGVPQTGDRRQPRETLMRPSTTDLNDGRNSLGIYETLSFIQECSSRHDVATLQERTRWQISGIRALMDTVMQDGKAVTAMVRRCRTDLLQKAETPFPENIVHLRMAYVRDRNQPELTLKTFERPSGGRGVATGQEAQVVTEVVKNWFPKVESRLLVPRRSGYIIPATLSDVLRTLLNLGIDVGVIEKNTSIEVESYLIKDIVPAADDYLAPEKIEVEPKSSTIKAQKGDYYVSMEQPAANLIPCLLEPQSEYGLIRYQMYKLVPEKGSVWPFLRIVKGKISAIPYDRKQ